MQTKALSGDGGTPFGAVITLLLLSAGIWFFIFFILTLPRFPC
jgi:hypothetical protein